MRRLLAAGAAAAVVLSLAGCPSGEVTAEAGLYLARENLDFYDDVVFPSSRRATYDDIFATVPVNLPLRAPYETTHVDAIITQRGDLQLTAHLDAGDLFDSDKADFGYLQDEIWNGESQEDRWGEELLEELTSGEADYRGLDQDIRLILLINLPDPGEEGWSSDGWEYPAELWANYRDVWVDDEGQEHDIDEDEIQLMSRMIVGGELFETTTGLRYDEELGTTVEVEEPDLVLDELTLPGEDGRFGKATGSFTLLLEAESFASSSGFATIAGTFDVDVHEDRWALEDLDVQEDLGASE